MTPVSGQTSRNVVGIATAAMAIGTSAMNEPNTNTSTMSAPAPATSTSISTLTLVVSLPPAPAARRASTPVTSTGAPPTVTPSSACWAASASA